MSNFLWLTCSAAVLTLTILRRVTGARERAGSRISNFRISDAERFIAVAALFALSWSSSYAIFES